MRCLTISECDEWRDTWSRRHQWKCQITGVTPLDRLPWFSTALVAQLMPFDHALLIIDKVIFGDDPPAIESLRVAIGEGRRIYKAPGHLFENDHEGVRAALEAALSEWVDFHVIFSPPRHALVADHASTQRFSPSRRARSRRSGGCLKKATCGYQRGLQKPRSC